MTQTANLERYPPRGVEVQNCGIGRGLMASYFASMHIATMCFSASSVTPIMPNLLFPAWPPTYNLTQSTMTQTCFGPTPVPGAEHKPFNETTGAFLRQWGVIALDFETEETLWAHARPKVIIE